ncbi:iron-siderophore ABC transporter substrate-binding protein [Bifidobacterium sp. ESL0763]|uniref:iron-siderophore ABC transporter substrate-binding protein n=1 Tax=Bifidobacterium sp. ESL0763 TaxID=2983227 RepID=UPI0023F694F8|nr:iron-siderophore ABC transporter substrate-binding protein [Bifidobacterium sp. ESL0763]MDF7664491.1 iron-siderophore ABC transporter substrate-binding protein [Bifidobacterium sp. ESL0763]
MSLTSSSPHRLGHTLVRATAALVAVASLGALAACGTSGSAGKGAEQSQSASAGKSAKTQGFPVTIKHVYGTTTIKSKPTRVATVGWGTPDNLIALGVTPVSIQKNTFGKTTHGGFLPWTYSALQKVGVKPADMPQLHDESDGVDVEAIAAAKPDLILGMQSGMTRGEYQKLSEIAPTVAYQKVSWGDPWRGMIRTTAQALGEPDKGDKLVASLESQLKSDAAQYPQLNGKTGAVMSFDASKLSSFSVYTTTDVRPQLLNDLGLKTPASVAKLSRGTTKFYKDVSAENADQFKDVDVIVTYGTPDLLAAMQKDPLLSKIPAVKRGSVVVVDNDSEMANALDPSALSIQQTDAQYAKLLADAAAKVQ